MTPPPPRPDDDSPPPVAGGGWEVVEPVEPPPPAPRDPLLDDPLFAELVEAKPLPDLTIEPVAPPPLPVAVPVEVIPEAQLADPPRAAPVAPARARPAPPPRPSREPEPPADLPRPRVFMACAVLGCFGLGLLGALGFLAYAAIYLLSGINDTRTNSRLAGAKRPGPVTTTRLAEQSGVVALTRVVDGVGRAAGGRYLLLRTSGTNKLLMFDPVAGEVVHDFDLGEPGALFAGSASKLFVYRPQARFELERWDLETRQREETAKKPSGLARPDAIAVGAGVDGPVYLISLPSNGEATIRVIDPVTLQETASHRITRWEPVNRVHARMSDDGEVLTVNTKAGAQLVRFADPRPPALLTLGAALVSRFTVSTPARDGEVVYTPFGRYDAKTGAGLPGRKAYTFPTAHGADLFLSQGRTPTGALSDEIRLHLGNAPDEHMMLTEVRGPLGAQPGDVSDVTADQRVHLWPAAGLAAVLTTDSPSQLLLSKVDVPKRLSDLHDPYLVIGSDPPAWAWRGVEWRYRPLVWTNADGARSVSVVDGPAGMLPTGNGEIVWTPGAGAPPASAVRIRVAVGDQQAEQSFRVAVVGDPDDD